MNIFITDNYFNHIDLRAMQFGLDYWISNRLGRLGKSTSHLILRAAHKYSYQTPDPAINYLDSERILMQIGFNNFEVIAKNPNIPDDVEKEYPNKKV
jgi:hypothetical protein